MDISSFQKRGSGHLGFCKKCASQKRREYLSKNKDYIHKRENEYRKRKLQLDPSVKEKHSKKKKKYNQSQKGKRTNRIYKENNKERLIEQNHIWYKNNKKRHRETGKAWIKNNPEKYKKLLKRRNEKRTNDPLLNFQNRIRSSMRSAWNNLNIIKAGKTFTLLGYSPKDLRDHLIKYLHKPCSLCNKTLIELQNSNLDHIIPLGSAVSSEDIIKLNQIPNLRLICVKCNLDKIPSDILYIKQVRSQNKIKEDIQ